MKVLMDIHQIVVIVVSGKRSEIGGGMGIKTDFYFSLCTFVKLEFLKSVCNFCNFRNFFFFFSKLKPPTKLTLTIPRRELLSEQDKFSDRISLALK